MTNDGRKPIVIRKTRPQFSQEQKAGFAFVAVTGVLAVVLGSLFVVRHMSAPFDLNYEGPRFISNAERAQQEIDQQKQSDTDGDTLSDYDELYRYRTSPYLRDTDSDGVNDASEVAAGTDPTCSSDLCEEGVGNVYDAPGAVSTFDVPETPVDFGIPLAAPDAAVDEQLNAISNLSVAEVRDLLISAGANKSEVDQLSDEELMALYKSVVSDIQAQAPQEATQAP